MSQVDYPPKINKQDLEKERNEIADKLKKMKASDEAMLKSMIEMGLPEERIKELKKAMGIEDNTQPADNASDKEPDNTSPRGDNEGVKSKEEIELEELDKKIKEKEAEKKALESKAEVEKLDAIKKGYDAGKSIEDLIKDGFAVADIEKVLNPEKKYAVGNEKDAPMSPKMMALEDIKKSIEKTLDDKKGEEEDDDDEETFKFGDIEKSMVLARQNYINEYQQNKKESGKRAKIAKIKNSLLNIFRKEDKQQEFNEEKYYSKEFKNAKEAYNQARRELAEKMMGDKRIELIGNGLSGDELEKALLQYKATEVLDKTIIQERKRLIDMRANEPLVKKAVWKQLINGYMKLKPWQKRAISVGFFTLAAGTGLIGVGAYAGYGLAHMAGIKFAASMGIGTLVKVSTKGIDKIKKKSDERFTQNQALSEEALANRFALGEITMEEYEKAKDVLIEEKRKRDRNRVIVKAVTGAGIAMLLGAATSYGVGHFGHGSADAVITKPGVEVDKTDGSMWGKIKDSFDDVKKPNVGQVAPPKVEEINSDVDTLKAQAPVTTEPKDSIITKEPNVVEQPKDVDIKQETPLTTAEQPKITKPLDGAKDIPEGKEPIIVRKGVSEFEKAQEVPSGKEPVVIDESGLEKIEKPDVVADQADIKTSTPETSVTSPDHQDSTTILDNKTPNTEKLEGLEDTKAPGASQFEKVQDLPKGNIDESGLEKIEKPVTGPEPYNETPVVKSGEVSDLNKPNIENNNLGVGQENSGLNTQSVEKEYIYEPSTEKGDNVYYQTDKPNEVINIENDPRNIETIKDLKEEIGRYNFRQNTIIEKAETEEINGIKYNEWNDATDHVFGEKKIIFNSYEDYEKEKTLQQLFGNGEKTTEYIESLDKNAKVIKMNYFRETPEWSIVKKIPAKHFFDFSDPKEIDGSALSNVPKSDLDNLIKAGIIKDDVSTSIDGVQTHTYTFANKDELLRLSKTYERFDKLNALPIGNEDIEKYIGRISRDLHQTDDGTYFIFKKKIEIQDAEVNDGSVIQHERAQYRNYGGNGNIYPTRGIYNQGMGYNPYKPFATRIGGIMSRSFSYPVRMFR